jgi:hypothetical protein
VLSLARNHFSSTSPRRRHSTRRGRAMKICTGVKAGPVDHTINVYFHVIEKK